MLFTPFGRITLSTSGSLLDDLALCQQFLNKIDWERKDVSSSVQVFGGRHTWNYKDSNKEKRLYLITRVGHTALKTPSSEQLCYFQSYFRKEEDLSNLFSSFTKVQSPAERIQKCASFLE